MRSVSKKIIIHSLYPIQRRFYLPIFFLLFLFFLEDSSLTASSQVPIKVEVKVDKRDINIGDKIRYTLSVVFPKDFEVELPSFGENLGQFSIRDFGRKENNLIIKRKIVQWYVLDIYFTGEYTIPSAVVKYRKKKDKEWKTLSAPEIKIKVKSLLTGVGEDVDIRDIKPPVLPRLNPGMYWLLLLLLIIGFIIGLWFFLKKKEGQEIIKPISAHIKAYQSLEELKRKSLIEKGRLEEYYVILSSIVRHYLEDRFNIHAPEMTTEEFLESVKGSNKLSWEQRQLLRDFLEHCDLVKFAKFIPSSQEAELSFQAAKRLVDQTKKEEEMMIEKE